MPLKSPYPDIPPLPETNSHNILLNRPDQAEWADYTMYIEASTGRKYSHKAFKQMVLHAATGLDSFGLNPGHMIGIISENNLDYPVLVNSLLALTVPYALISSFSTGFELDHALKLSKATHLFVDPRTLSSVLPVAKKARIPSRNIYIMGHSVGGHKSFRDHICSKGAKLPQVNVRPAKRDTLAYLVFSSGTSGPPKAVMISHNNLSTSLLQAAIIAQTGAEVSPPPVPQNAEGVNIVLGFLPMHHSYGLHAYCFRSCLARMTFVIMPKWNIQAALKLIPKYGVTALTLVPSIVHQLVNHPNISKANFKSITYMNSGAAYLPDELAKRMSSLVPVQATFSQGYGMSEGTIGSISRPVPGGLEGRLKAVPGSIGVLMPSASGKLLRDDGTEADVGEPGELYFHGPNVALGYWENDQANKETFLPDGWLRTGDKFYVDKDGYFFFVDRAKDTLKVSGSQVSPVEIENVLLEHPKRLITDVTVAGVSGGRTDDEKVPRAWVVLSPAGKKLGATGVIKELETWHQENLSKYKWLRGGIEIVKEIPKSPTGKTLRRVLQDRYESRLKRKAKL
ncbi:hypothetical protein C8J56DRAFT_927244 [Mycena floridula]|nr:hypothetical protein C8J56DRAFT_927244 [Mycena floridula]